MNKRLMIAVGATILTSLSLVHAQSASQAAVIAADAQAPPMQMQPQAAGMAKMHEQMMAEQMAAAARLEQLIADMHFATGDAKMTAVTQVVTELVHQQRAMHAHMSMMCGQMGHQMGPHAPPKQ